MKRMLSALLLAAMLMGTAVSCSEKPAGEETTASVPDTPSADEQARPASEEETELTDGLPDTDMQGFELNILHHSQEWLSWAYNVLEAEELTGDVLNDAIYIRNEAIQDRFNAKIATETMDQVGADVIAQLAVSGDSSYDLALMYDVRLTGAIQYLADMKELTCLAFDKVWWNPYGSSIFLIGGKQYAASGNFSLSMLSRVSGYVFNADMMTNLNLGSPYEEVRNGTWTIDTMMKMADAATQDINGDGQTTNDDQFGVDTGVKGHYVRMILGSGISLITQDENGYPVFSLSTDDVAITKLQHILDVNSHGGWYNTGNQNVDAADPVVNGTFQNGRALFKDGNPQGISAMRDYEFNFGFVPVPKYDETQDHYIAPAYGAEMSILPMSYDASQSENIGMLLEAMAFYSQQNIVPEYIETLVKTKYSRDAESAEMFSIAFDGFYCDFGINAWQEQVAAKLFKGSFVGLAGNFGSVLKTMQKSVDAEIAGLIKQIDNAG